MFSDSNDDADEEDSHDDLKPIKAIKAAAESKAAAKKEAELEKDEAVAKAKKLNSENDGSIFMNVQYWKEEREKIDGSFMAARTLFTKHGPWDLPDVITERKFRLIAKSTLAKMDR